MKEQSPEQKWMVLCLIRELGIRGDDCIGAAKFVGLGGKMRKFHSDGFIFHLECCLSEWESILNKFEYFWYNLVIARPWKS